MGWGEAAAPAPDTSGFARTGAIVLSHAKSIAAESQTAGLWLLHGEAPPPRSPPEPISRGRQLLGRIASAARWAGWMAPAAGLILILLAVSLVLHPAPPGERPSGSMSAVAPQPSSPLVAAHSLIPPLSIQLPDLRLDQVQLPPAASAQMMTEPTERQMVKKREQRRSPASVKRSHTSFARRGSPVLIPGLLTPPKD